MKKNILFFILLLILFAGGGFFLLELHSNNHGNQENRRNIARATPPPTLPLVKTSAGDSNTKKISFQSFTVSFLVPSDLKILKEVDPTSEDTQIGSNYIALYTPDTVIDPKK